MKSLESAQISRYDRCKTYLSLDNFDSLWYGLLDMKILMTQIVQIFGLSVFCGYIEHMIKRMKKFINFLRIEAFYYIIIRRSEQLWNELSSAADPAR